MIRLFRVMFQHLRDLVYEWARRAGLTRYPSDDEIRRVARILGPKS